MKRLQGSFDLLRVFVGAPRPEEPLQAIPFAPRHDVHVKMRNTLADAIVDGHEGAFRLHALEDGLGEQPDVGEEGADKRVGQIEKRFDVALGDEERVSGKKRPMIEERERNIVLKNLERRHEAANDLAECAMFVEDRNIFHWFLIGGICLP